MARGLAKRREYRPGAPLVARERIQFRGVVYERGASLPLDQLDPRKHKQLWMIRKADHPQKEPPVLEVPTPTPPDPDPDPDMMTPDELEAATAPTSPTFETANMRLPPDQVATMRVTPDPPRAPAPSSKRHHRR